MGYSTDFTGRIELNKPLTDSHAEYLARFADSRRMVRDPEIVSRFDDPLRIAVDLPIGEQGGFYVGTEAGDSDVISQDDPRFNPEYDTEAYNNRYLGSTHDSSITNFNYPPEGQPGLWCQWIPSDDKQGIEWDCQEKFSYYVEWLKYIIDNFLEPWGYIANGEISWHGEDNRDIGVIYVNDNQVKAVDSEIINVEPNWE